MVPILFHASSLRRPQNNKHYQIFFVSDFLKSIIKVLRVPLYTLHLLSSLVSMIGLSSTMEFAPKYIETQFNVTAWEANIIMGEPY